MANIRIELDHAGMAEMLKSKPVQQALQETGNEIKEVALADMPSHETGPLGYKVDTDVGKGRALTWIRTTHMLGPVLEAKYGPLRRAAQKVLGEVKARRRRSRKYKWEK
jgi:hypothetical protein